jgi:molybdopterin-guanine dinucleotide biosynthesis protein A
MSVTNMPGLEFMKIVAAILAGGKASRLGGIAKGLLPDAMNVPWIERLINELGRAGISEIVLSANEREPYARFGRTILADRHQNIGPLGGIEAVLQHLAARCEAVLFVPCDLPNITAVEFIALLAAYNAAQSARPGKGDSHLLPTRGYTGAPRPSGCFAQKVAVTFSGPRIVMAETVENQHPLCAVVPNAILPDVSAAISAGDYGVLRLWKTLGAIAVRIDEPERLANINTQEELRRWQEGAK